MTEHTLLNWGLRKYNASPHKNRLSLPEFYSLMAKGQDSTEACNKARYQQLNKLLTNKKQSHVKPYYKANS